MSDYDLSKLPDLLARLDVDDTPFGVPAPPLLMRQRKEAAAAIRALMAENSILIAARDAQAFDIANAVAAEREACAKVCRDRADFNLREAKSTGRTMFVDRYQESLECEAAIRARGAA